MKPLTSTIYRETRYGKLILGLRSANRSYFHLTDQSGTCKFYLTDETS